MKQIYLMDRDFRLFGDEIFDSIVQMYEIYNSWTTANLPLTWKPTGVNKNSGKQNVDSHQPGPRTRGSDKKAGGGGNAAANHSTSKNPPATRNKGRKRTQSDSDSLSDSRTLRPFDSVSCDPMDPLQSDSTEPTVLDIMGGLVESISVNERVDCWVMEVSASSPTYPPNNRKAAKLKQRLVYPPAQHLKRDLVDAF